MTDNFDHNNFEKNFFSKSKIKYSKSMEDVWSEMENKMNEQEEGKIIKTNFRKVLVYGIAAVFVIGLGLVSFMRLYSVSVKCPKGQHSSIILPDSSKVTLNANSELAYYPYWWKFSRKLNFKGEAFFEVEKGKTFEVDSEVGTTTVLGTSFNIFARGDEYKVHCLTGSVKVETSSEKPVILSPNEFTFVEKKNNKLIKDTIENSEKSILWIENKFDFKNIPLFKVYEEVERQYNIKIVGKERFVQPTRFSFERVNNPELVIKNIGKPFGITCEKISNRKYQLVKEK